MSLPGRLLARYRGLSDPLRTERRFELVCLVLALVLVLQLGLLVQRALQAPDPEDVAPAAGTLRVGELAERTGVDASGSAEMLARPLFWEGRRPVAEVVEKPVKKQPVAKPLQGVELLGVFGGGDTRGIIASVDGERKRLLQGDAVKGWTLQQIEGDSVTLVAGGRREVISLQRDYGSISFEVEKEGAGNSPSSGSSAKARTGRSGRLSLGGRPASRD